MAAVRSQLALALAVAAVAMQAAQVLAQCPLQPVMFVPVNPPTAIYPVAAWGQRPCPCLCPAPPAAPPVPAVQPQAPADPAPQPEPPAPAPAIDLSMTPDAGPAIGSGGFALATPMIGDFLGGFSTVSIALTGSYAGIGFFSIPGVPVSGTVAASVLATVPSLGHGPFKIAENEFARPVDRVFAYYNFYRVQGQLQTSGPIAVPAGVLGGAFTPVFVQPTPNRFEFDLHRETFGFEKTFLNGNASIGVRIPTFQSNGGAPFSARLATPQSVNTLGGFEATFIGDTPLSFEDAQLGDISVVFKYAWLNTDAAVNTMGLVVTAPTGPGLDTVEGEINSTIFQPYVGFYRALGGSFYAHGFSAMAVPTDGKDVTIWFNDLGIGYRAGRFVPTAELHINTPLNHRGLESSPIGMSDQVVLTAGTHFFITQRAILTLAAGLPVTGPQPYRVEAAALFNYRF